MFDCTLGFSQRKHATAATNIDASVDWQECSAQISPPKSTYRWSRCCWSEEGAAVFIVRDYSNEGSSRGNPISIRKNRNPAKGAVCQN